MHLNLNKFSTTESFDYYRNLTRLYQNVYGNQSMKEIKNTYASILFNDTKYEQKKLFTKPIEYMLTKCKMTYSTRNQECKPADFEWLFNKRYGNCFRFNTHQKNKSMIKIDEFGLGKGLRLELDLSLPPELNNLTRIKGVYLSIDDRSVNPYIDFEDVILVPTGLETNILIDKSIFHKYPKPYSTCDFDVQDLSSNYYTENSIYFKAIESDPSYLYTQSLCLEICRLNLM